MLGQVEPRIHKHEIRLQHDEHDGEDHVDPSDRPEAGRVRLDLKEGDKLHGEVGEGTGAEDEGTEADGQAAVALGGRDSKHYRYRLLWPWVLN